MEWKLPSVKVMSIVYLRHSSRAPIIWSVYVIIPEEQLPDFAQADASYFRRPPSDQQKKITSILWVGECAWMHISRLNSALGTHDFGPILCSPTKPSSDASRRVAYWVFMAGVAIFYSRKRGIKLWLMKCKHSSMLKGYLCELTLIFLFWSVWMW